MKSLAESDSDVYLPNPEPTARVDYILICMEPSLGHWARSAEEARAKVASGFRNFLSGIEPMLLHFSVRRFLREKSRSGCGLARIIHESLSLTPGTRLGVYEITAQIGEGGMGQVYRATDTKLKRQVAIKTLPPSVAADRDRLARFQREAEVLASLNCPHIAAIHGLEDADGVKALVMELVEGDDLSQRLARGPIPLDEALPIAKQVFHLEAANEKLTNSHHCSDVATSYRCGATRLGIASLISKSEWGCPFRC